MPKGSLVEPAGDEPPRLGPGGPAPDFALPDVDGDQVSLSSYRGRKVVVYFFVAAGTADCTTQAHDFRDSLNDLAEAGVDVLAVSPDPADKLRAFRDQEGLRFPLLSDPESAAVFAYGAYDRTSRAVVRSTFVVDEHGDVAAAYYDIAATGQVARLRKDLGL